MQIIKRIEDCFLLTVLFLSIYAANKLIFMKKKLYYLLFLLIISTNCSKSQAMINSETVKELDLQKYLGTWYEIARYPHSFEKELVGVTATYSLRADGKIKVENKGYKKTLNGEMKIAIGKAKIPNLKEPTKL